MYSRILQADVLTDSTYLILSNLYNSFFKYIGYYSSYIYIHVLGYFLFLYAMSEWSFLKKIFLPKETLINQKVFDQKESIDRKIHEYFYLNENFKDPEISLSSCSKALNITKDELIDYLTLTKRGMFKDFVNKLRTEEVKKLILNDHHQKYDLVGVASQCGFNSKSTFFRVFKNIEGITPREYQKKHRMHN